MATTTRKNWRIPERTIGQIDDLRKSATAGTITETAVVVESIDAMHRKVYGRRSIQMRPKERPA